MTPIEPLEIVLDRPRKVLINHLALFKAENEINRRRGAKPEEWASIDVLMVDAFNRIYRARGMLPRDLLVVMIWAGLGHETSKPALTVEQITGLLDNSEKGVAELSGEIWNAYFLANTKNLKAADTDEKKNQSADSMTPTDGSTNGASHESS